ncbi:DUF58 domain-containing protein [Oceanithermus sp.]
MPRYRIRTSLRRRYPGGRLSKHTGESLDFLELRGYSPGDDPRFVDWRAYARSGRLYTRVWQGEERARFSLWLDGSASMNLWGKLDYARQVARVLLEAALPEETYWLSPAGPRRLRHPPPGPALTADDAGPLAAAKRLARARGQVIMLTDALDEGDWPAFFRSLSPRRPVLVQILASEELEPPEIELEWRDVESGAVKRVGAREVAAWRAGLEEHLRTLARAAGRYGGYVHLRVGEEIVPALVRQRLLEWR